MAFCSQCGKPVDEAGRCVCGNVNKKPQTVQAGSQYVQPPVNEEQSGARYGEPLNNPEKGQEQTDFQAPPAQENMQIPSQPEEQQSSQEQAQVRKPSGPNVVNDCLEILKRFFSAKPTQVLDVAIKTRKPVYAVVGVLYIILNGLLVLAVCRNALASSLGIVYYQLESYVGIPYLQLFMIGFLYALISFLVYSGLFKGIHAVKKQKVPFGTVMNMVSAAMIPMVAASAVASIFSFVGSVGLVIAMLLVAAAQFMTVILYYIGLQKEARFETSPLWMFAGAHMVHQLVSWVFIYVVASNVLSGFISTLMTDVFSSWGSWF